MAQSLRCDPNWAAVGRAVERKIALKSRALRWHRVRCLVELRFMPRSYAKKLDESHGIL